MKLSGGEIRPGLRPAPLVAIRRALASRHIYAGASLELLSSIFSLSATAGCETELLNCLRCRKSVPSRSSSFAGGPQTSRTVSSGQRLPSALSG
jgi:hypothetical protein